MKKALALCLFLGCGGGEIPESQLPKWSGHSTELFDDVIEPRAVGLELNITATPRADPTLRERTQTGDAVLRVRVETVTQSGYGRNVRHQLSFVTLEKLAGQRPPPVNFVVTMDESNPSIGIIRSVEARLGGKTFIAFVKAFGQDGERQYHFHLAPDTKDVRDAVQDAVALGDFK
jgi:hypothetical protein